MNREEPREGAACKPSIGHPRQVLFRVILIIAILVIALSIYAGLRSPDTGDSAPTESGIPLASSRTHIADPGSLAVDASGPIASNEVTPRSRVMRCE